MTLSARSHLIRMHRAFYVLFLFAQLEGLFLPDHAMHWPLARLASGRLTADVHCEEIDMYCSDCHQQVLYHNPDNQGWCEKCKRVVKVSPSSMSSWCVMAGLLLPWLLSP